MCVCCSFFLRKWHSDDGLSETPIVSTCGYCVSLHMANGVHAREMTSVFSDFDSADILRLYPPFRYFLVINGRRVTRKNALRAWRRRHGRHRRKRPDSE